MYGQRGDAYVHLIKYLQNKSLLKKYKKYQLPENWHV